MSSSKDIPYTKETIFPESNGIVIRSWKPISERRADELIKIAKLISKARIGPSFTSANYDRPSQTLDIALERANHGPCQTAICLSDSLLYHRQESALEGHVMYLKDAVVKSEPRHILIELIRKLNRHGYIITVRIHWNNFGWRLNRFNRPRPILLEIDNISHRQSLVEPRVDLHASIDAISDMPLQEIVIPRLRINIELSDEDRVYVYTHLMSDPKPEVRALANRFAQRSQISIPQARD